MDINKGSSHAIRRECFEFLKKKKKAFKKLIPNYTYIEL